MTKKRAPAKKAAAKAAPARRARTKSRKTAPRKAAPRKAAPTGRKRGPKPHGYTTVSPYLVIAGAQRVIDFLKQAFGATDLRRYEMPDGTIMHAEVRIDDTVIMMGDAGDEWPSIPSFLHVYVPDVDATYARALKAGGVSVQEPVRKEGDPDRRGGVKDPGGNTWWISTQVE
jgi:PhnB protein